MNDSTTPQDSAAMSPASAGSVAGDVVEHAKKCVKFWRSMMDEADRIGTEAPSLEIGGVSDLVDGLLAEIERLRLTDAEREAVEQAAGVCALDATDERCLEIAAALRGLLERLG